MWFLVCDILPRHSTRYIFNEKWFVSLSSCHRHSVIIQGLSQLVCLTVGLLSRDLRFNSLTRQCFPACCLNCSKLCGAPEGGVDLGAEKGQMALENDTEYAIHSSRVWVNMWAECRGKGREEGETDRHGPIQLCPRCRWLTQHVIPLLFFRAIIDPTTSSPLRVSIPASVYVGVCACKFVFSCDKLTMIQWGCSGMVPCQNRISGKFKCVCGTSTLWGLRSCCDGTNRE